MALHGIKVYIIWISIQKLKESKFLLLEYLKATWELDSKVFDIFIWYELIVQDTRVLVLKWGIGFNVLFLRMW